MGWGIDSLFWNAAQFSVNVEKEGVRGLEHFLNAVNRYRRQMAAVWGDSFANFIACAKDPWLHNMYDWPESYKNAFYWDKYEAKHGKKHPDDKRAEAA